MFGVPCLPRYSPVTEAGASTARWFIISRQRAGLMFASTDLPDCKSHSGGVTDKAGKALILHWLTCTKYHRSCKKWNQTGSRTTLLLFTWKTKCSLSSLSDLTQNLKTASMKNNNKLKVGLLANTEGDKTDCKYQQLIWSQGHFQTHCRCLPLQLFRSLELFPATWRPCGKMAENGDRGLYWQMKCVRSPLMQRHPPSSAHRSSSAAWMLHIVRPFIHFGSQSSHSVVRLHYTQRHCSVHLEAILLPIQWRSDFSSTAQNLFGSLQTCSVCFSLEMQWNFCLVHSTNFLRINLILSHILGPA